MAGDFKYIEEELEVKEVCDKCNMHHWQFKKLLRLLRLKVNCKTRQ